MVRPIEEQAAFWPQTRSRWRSEVWVFIRRYPLGSIGGAVLAVMVLAAIFAPLIATHDPLRENIPNRIIPPGSAAWLGTDYLGRDLYSRIVYGARVSLYVGLVSVLLGAVVGAIIGVVTAYVGGGLDLTVQRVVDAMLGIPSLIFALAMVVALGASLVNVTLAIGVTFAPRVARLARSQALAVKQDDFVLASRALGARVLRTILRHVLPNSLTPVIVVSTGYLGTAIVTEASLSFLGLGVPPPHPTWGGILQQAAQRYQEDAPWLTIFPGVALAAVVFSFNLFGDALQDHLDPRLRRK